MSLCPSLFTAAWASSTLMSDSVFSVLGHSMPQNYIEFLMSQVIICVVYSFVFWLENGFLQGKHS